MFSVMVLTFSTDRCVVLTTMMLRSPGWQKVTVKLARAAFFARSNTSARKLFGAEHAMACRSFHYGSKEYTCCFLDLPSPDVEALRARAIEYLDTFDQQHWHDDPMVTLLQGSKLTGGEEMETTDALGNVSGEQIVATKEQVQQLRDHIRSFQSPYKDLRDKIRPIEHELLHDHTGFLIGNQCVDFQKQDGVTEIEESIMANTVERRLNDLLLRDEASGMVQINRQPIFVSCVSNFTNFLDLSRKSLRSLECGIPCVVLSRSNTSQHSYRWTELLNRLLAQHGIDAGMLTFASCSLDDIKDLTQSCQDRAGMLYTTCSRDLAATIKAGYPNTVASTGGPNTLVATCMTDPVRRAIQTSASIESSGQCTALRHCVVPLATTDDDITACFNTLQEIPDAQTALRHRGLDGVFAQHRGTLPPPPPDYVRHPQSDAYIKIDDNLPATGIPEYWRKVVVDVSRLDPTDRTKVRQLAAWLNENQPISLAVNGPRAEAMQLGLALFERTSMVVYTLGSSDMADMPPALTCQARPQEGECFGEFPPRKELNKYTKFPVIVPSSNPSYDTTYCVEFLAKQSVSDYFGASTKAMLNDVHSSQVRGYCVLLIEYLQDATNRNPKLGFGTARTALWGLQRPPLGTKTYIYCDATSTIDDVAPIYTLFHVTTARLQVELSIDPGNRKAVVDFCEKLGVPYQVESRESMHDRLQGRADVFNIVDAQPLDRFPMVGNFVSLYFPLGHVKSTKPDDQEFVVRARLSDKWLNALF